MLNSYFFPIETAAITFPLVALLATLPYMIYNYRKYGSISIWRTVVLFSFAFYLLCAYYLVILPLPDPAKVAEYTSAQFDWMPFHFIQNIAESSFSISKPATWLPVLKSMTVLEPLFNLFLLMPFGVYLAYYFKKDKKKCLLFAFFLSFFFEMTQLSGLYGIYPRPYRLFSTDDLMLNSLGGMIGYFFYDKLLRFLPKKERIDQKARQRSEAVGYARRISALIADGVITLVLSIILDKYSPVNLNSLYISPLFSFVYYVGFCLLTKGQTPGKALVRIKIIPSTGKPPFAFAVILRLLLRGALIFAFSFFNMLIGRNGDFNLLWLSFIILLALLSIIDLLYSVKKGKLLWYERISRTKNVSTFRTEQV